MTQHPSFGGPWTQEKLEILRRYLDAYTTALKNQPFDLWYIDAFAGSGWYQTRDDNIGSPYDEFESLRQGSAQIALEVVDKPFDHLIYIEKNPELVASLSKIEDQNPHRFIEVIRGDANEELPIICEDMKPSDRAVVFLDPYATEVDWATVEAIAQTQKIDCWILFPISALTRMMDNDAKPNQQLAAQLDRVFGGRRHWEDELYAPNPQISLFGDSDNVLREPQYRIADVYMKRLKTVFEAVAPTSRILRNSQSTPLFQLMFAAGNPRGARIAVQIADHILKNW